MALRAPWGRMQGAATRACPRRIAEGWASGGRPERRSGASVTASRIVEHALREKRNAADGPAPPQPPGGRALARRDFHENQTVSKLLGASQAKAFARGRTRRLQSFFRTLLEGAKKRHDQKGHRGRQREREDPGEDDIARDAPADGRQSLLRPDPHDCRGNHVRCRHRKTQV
jgi:hypothetical protein